MFRRFFRRCFFSVRLIAFSTAADLEFLRRKKEKKKPPAHSRLSYFATEICRGEPDTQRADWFLLDSRVVRHVTIGLFCPGVSAYLAAMSIFMLLVFEVETGIASVCVLSSGVLVLLLIIIHSLIRAAHTAKQFRNEHAHNIYHSNPENIAGIRTSITQALQKNHGGNTAQPTCTTPLTQILNPSTRHPTTLTVTLTINTATVVV
uniref:Si:ch211-125m10.6 n=1 Tax=Cyprinus carpio TaxID=7962 RepID=A0A8C2I5X8_CYPCA